MENDNQSALKMASKYVSLQRTRHLAMKFHFVQELIQAGLVKTKYVASDMLTADGFTKPLTRVLFARFVARLGLVDFAENGEGVEVR